MKKIAIEEHWDYRLFDHLDERIGDMDEAGIDMQVLSATIMRNDNFSIADANKWARENNDGFARLIEKYPERFSSFAAVSLMDPQEAPRELERTVKQLNFKGVLIGGEKKTFLDDQEYWPFLETAEKLDVPIYLHPTTPSWMEDPCHGIPILRRSMWGFAAEAGLHALRLIMSGMFEKFPRLKIILGHMGENIPYQMWRIDNRWKNEKDGKEAHFAADPSASILKKKPSEYFKENFYITTSGMFWEPPLQLCRTAIGVDRILFAVDYNAENMVEAVKFIESANLSNQEREKIFHANTEKLLKL